MSDPDSRRSDADPARSEGQDAVDYLRQAGDHPLMYSFPHGAVFAFDQDLRYLSAGGRGLADVGLSRELLEGRTIHEVFPGGTSVAIEPLYRDALAGTSSTRDVPYGGRVYAQRLGPVVDAAGTVVAGLGFTQDVTEARAAEQALRESEERNRLTFEHAPIGQAIVELDGRWRQVNAAITRLTGYTEDELLQRTFQDITHPDDLGLDLGLLRQLVAGEIESYQIEKRYVTATGRIVWVLLSVAVVRDQQSTPLYFISQIQDITDRRRQHQALQDLTAMLAHDLRTPAQVISGFAELLQDSTQVEPVHEHAARIVAAAQAMTALLDNALTATTIDTGHLVASTVDVPLRHAVLTTVEGLDLGSLRVDTSAVEDLTARVDPVHLTQVLTNLLTNAVKYGGAEVTVTASSSPTGVRLSVADDGAGVDPSFVPHLFDRFSRSAAVRGVHQRGSGLGLYIVQRLLAANGASIRYLDRASGGATFEIDLRAATGGVAGTPCPVGDGSADEA